MQPHKISVRNLVEFILRTGDLSSAQFLPSRLEEGIRAHKKLQTQQGRYLKEEVSLRMESEQEGITIVIRGRADGLLCRDGLFIIDEIKSTMKRTASDAPEDPLHLAQAMFYAYMYASMENLEKIGVWVTYFSLQDESVYSYEHIYEIEELRDFVLSTVKRYGKWLAFLEDLKRKRDESIEKMAFPFPAYRSGQRKLVNDVYRAIRDQKRLFVKAPTGIGKTISTIFPSVKSLIYQENEKIFYLTSRGTNREAVRQTMTLLMQQGLCIRTVFLIAKEKVCPYGKCDLEICDYAKGHFDRINTALWDILENQRQMDRETVLRYSQSHRVCPFEFLLDIALFSDIIVGDYNYAFDPSVYLKRFFEEKQGRYIFLMDETHNFIDRVRDMFSATILKSDFLELRRSIKGFFEHQGSVPGNFQPLIRSLGKINRDLLSLRTESDEYCLEQMPSVLYKDILHFKEVSERCFAEDFQVRSYPFYTRWMELYFDCHHFCRIGEYYDERYRTLIDSESRQMRLRLQCIDPTKQIREDLSRCTALIAFSATLVPASYYVEMIGGREESIYLMLPSPFERSHLRILVDKGISTRYIHRKASLHPLAERIYTASAVKKGNYMVFFPSYEYMMAVYEVFVQEYPAVRTLVQSQGFTEEERERFLAQFREDNPHTMVAFVVLGGTFSEAIDLAGERLSGAIIVSIGLPKRSMERDVMTEYFKSQGKDGFDYAYRYGAMNKVMQAGGRVIRTPKDKGFLLLIDDRFLEEKTRGLIPEEWAHYEVVRSLREIHEKLSDFWRNERWIG